MLVIGMIILVVLVFLAFYVARTYNTFVTLGERVRNGKAQIATQVESRFDAVSSLIELTKQYERYESETLEKVVRQRMNISLDDASIDKIEENNDELNQIVNRLIALSESYPELKASDVYVKTMINIDTYENNVRHARMLYNDGVTKFNRLVRTFPSNILARWFKFTQEEYVKATHSKQGKPSLE